MSFASPLFLWLFLPVVLIAMLAARIALKHVVLSIASLAFYAVGGAELTLLLLSSIAINFIAGLLVEPAPYRPDGIRRRILIVAITLDLGTLALWKYLSFATEQLDRVLESIGLSAPVASLALPIGVSFYTFHQISYVVDVYRGVVPAQSSLMKFASYVSMFPQLIAGPIVRYKEIADQLDRPRPTTLDSIIDGFPRFALGLTKKVVIADSLAPVASALFDGPNQSVGAVTAWVGVIAYTLQIYFDFSGYSDMAIGLGRMMGFRLPENFDRPYSATTITDFWRRWHMSLSRWFRDYLYIPLGGNRRGLVLTYRNLVIVFLLAGIWHGANWTFLVWGAYHGVLLIGDRVIGSLARTPSVPRFLQRALTLVLVMVGWAIFRAHSLGSAGAVIASMTGTNGWGLDPVMHSALTNRGLLTLVVASAVVLLPPTFVMGRYLDQARSAAADNVRFAVTTLGMGYSVVLVSAGTFSPFLYYQF